jgi:hypothetical protein
VEESIFAALAFTTLVGDLFSISTGAAFLFSETCLSVCVGSGATIGSELATVCETGATAPAAAPLTGIIS